MARAKRRPPTAPVPPVELPPARTVTVPGRGEFFLRDSGLLGPSHEQRPVVYLLHGWTVTADLNFFGQYQALIDAGYRVLAIDHRGHGRGRRGPEPFLLTDCADDAAAVLRTLGLAPATIVGYSMGGAIAQLICRYHSDVVKALVLSGTAQTFSTEETRQDLKKLALLRVPLGTAPRATWRLLLSRMGWSSQPNGSWYLAEMLRHSSYAIIESGLEVGRFDSHAWARNPGVPTAFVLTTDDEVVPPDAQAQLAAKIEAKIFEAPISHMQIGERAIDYNPALIAALAHVHAKTPDIAVGLPTV